MTRRRAVVVLLLLAVIVSVTGCTVPGLITGNQLSSPVARPSGITCVVEADIPRSPGMEIRFFSNSMDNWTENCRQRIHMDIDALPTGDVDSGDHNAICQALVAQHGFRELPTLGNDLEFSEAVLREESNEAIIDVYIPFTGNAELFTLYNRSRPFDSPKYSFRVEGQFLKKQYGIAKERIAQIQEVVVHDLKSFDQYLEEVRHMAPLFNEHLLADAKSYFVARQVKVRQDKKAAATYANSGIKIRKRNDGSEKLIVPVQRIKVSTQAPPVPAKPSQPAPEPEISLADYDTILGIIQNMVRVYERSPSVFKNMGEEDLRMILLVGLNGLFEGGATGETFNGAGKTDILIRAKDKNIFIAECLIWDGPEHFRKKLTNQLFNYATWRDSKLAALVFNRNKGFTDVVAKMKEVTAGLPNKSGDMPCAVPSACRHRLKRADDLQREFVLTCMAFEVPT